MVPDAQRDLCRLVGLLAERIPFRFLRFSDGEMEIIRNERLEISETHLHWRRGVVRHRLPAYDVKTFDPDVDREFRGDLVEAAKHRAIRYFKGVPSTHNDAVADRDLMVELNDGLDSYVTFSDLLINSNFRSFLSSMLPVLLDRDIVYVVGNFRMRPDLLHPAWQLIPVPDNFFTDYVTIRNLLQHEIGGLPGDALVLASASSLSNIVGYSIDVSRPDLTFIDIGTTLHGYMGLDANTRDYHVEGQRWAIKTALPKVRYRRAPHYRIRW